MIVYFWVALGGAIGSVARFTATVAAARLWGERFPWGTIGINVFGSFVIGAFAALTAPTGALPGSANLRALVMVGLCGGFTTFSAFSLQTLLLARGGAWVAAAANVLLSVALCLVAVTLGYVAVPRGG
jgi:CrcB protein